MIRVCHMTSVHAPEDVRIFHKECTSLAKAGYVVYLVERGISYEKNGVNIIGVGEPKGGRLSRMAEFSKRVYKAALKVNADIYHFHDPELLPYGIKLKKRGKKVIFDSHEYTTGAILEKTWMPEKIRKIVANIFLLYERSVCKKFDAIISVAPHLVDYYNHIGKNVIQITNYPICNEYICPDYCSKRIVFAGGIKPEWNHSNIIKAISHIPDCEYILCGSVDDNYDTELKRIDGWKKVNFMGRVPHARVAEIMKTCSIGIALLSPGNNTDGENGTLGNTKIFEEMMAGLPILCTCFKSWKCIVEKFKCGICVDPDNIEEITKAIRYLLDNPDVAQEMGENGRRAIKKEFNWSVEEKKLLALYEDLVKEAK